MSDTTSDPVQNLLRDAFSRVSGLVDDLTETLSPELATWRADGEANTIAWLLWHLTRIQDDHVAGLAGVDQVWPAWRERFALPFEPWALGYGQSPDEAAQVAASAELLAGYHSDVRQATLAYVDRLDATELARVVDEAWDPPVTASVRLVSVVSDTLQHLGQAAYVKGLAARAGVA